jgi:hypothetical protein
MASTPGLTVTYHHTQRGIWIVAACLAAALVTAEILSRTGNLIVAVVMIILLVTSFVFASLTVEVDDQELRWRFGPGFWTYRLARRDIAAITVVRNTWWNGFGIRMRPGFRLYNVSGLDAVELRLKSGDIRRIGTDDPAGLAAALRA